MNVGGGVMILVLTDKGIQELDNGIQTLKADVKAFASMERINYHFLQQGDHAFKVYDACPVE
jgi:hypothetical protein